MSKQPFAMVLYALAAICLLMPLCAALLLALNHGQLPADLFFRYLPAAACVWAGLIVFGLLIGLGTLMEKETSMPRKLQGMLAEILDALQVVGRSVSEPRAAIPSDTLQAPEAAARPATAPPPAAPAASATPTSSARIDAASVQRLVSLLEEIRDTSLLNETQRQKRLTQLMNGRRRVAMAKVEELITSARWPEADALLCNAEQEFTDDSLVRAMRRRYENARADAEQQALAHAKQAIQDQIALSSWDRATELAASFAQQHPGATADDLVSQVAQLRREYTESMGGELYEEMRTNIEQRSWRRAYDAAKRLLAKFPDHHRAAHIRSQLEILKGNAETEQRNAMEARIQEMIRAKRFNDAIELAQELQKTFPASPQAEVAGQLITRLRDRLREQSTDAA